MGIIECGVSRGQQHTYEKIEMVNNQELFAYTVLRDLYSAMEKAKWEVASNSKTKTIVRSKPSLRRDFTCQPNEKYKRKWHLLRILGEGTDAK